MAPQNGTTRITITVVISVVSLVVGLVVGGLKTRVDVEQRFIPRDVYLRDQSSILGKLDRIEQKLDTLTRAVERNSVLINNTGRRNER